MRGAGPDPPGDPHRDHAGHGLEERPPSGERFAPSPLTPPLSEAFSLLRTGWSSPLALIGGMTGDCQPVTGQSDIKRSSTVLGIQHMNFAANVRGHAKLFTHLTSASLHFHVGTRRTQNGPGAAVVGPFCPWIRTQVLGFH